MSKENGIKLWIGRATHILAEEIKNSSSLFYCIILGVYQSGRFHEYVLFTNFSRMTLTLEAGISFILLILLGVYLESILVSAIRKRWVIVLALILLVGFLFLCARMQRDKFDGLMIAILAVCAYGKDYERILKVMLAVAVATVAIAMIGLPLGITVESPKVGLYGTGLAFGTAHPNVWGSYIFFIFVLVWYLFVKDKGKKLRISYLVTSWAVFMVLVPKCRTQALLLLLFPLTIWLSKRVTGFSMVKGRILLHKSVLWILVLFPIFCFVLTVFLGWQREWLAIHTMGTYVENFSKRFIQSGLAFREHGFPIFGELIRFRSGLAEELGGYKFSLYVLDNAYVTYTIYRGLIWMIPALLWLSFANWKIIKRGDYNLLTISILFCLMGLMERYTLGVYNFVFLYPLAISMLAKDTTKEDSGQPSTSGEEAST